MAQEGDDIVSLPSPPPPRPAARREAIDAALHKFGGIEDAPARKPQRRRPGWASLQGRPAGAIVAAAVVAIIGIPAIQIAIRDNPTPVPEESAGPDLTAPSQDVADRSPLAPDAQPAAPAEVPDEAVSPSPRTSEQPVLTVAEGRMGFAPDRTEKAGMAAPSAPPMMAPPPPPPPPAPAEPQAEASAADNIVVTGSRVSRPNLESVSPINVVQSDAVDAQGEFLSRLQDAFAANNRRSVMRLVGLPLRVNFSDEPRTYRSARDVERDYDRIFTPAVRQAAIGLKTGALDTRDDGRLQGKGRLWFGCGQESCASAGEIRIREVVP